MNELNNSYIFNNCSCYATTDTCSTNTPLTTSNTISAYDYCSNLFNEVTIKTDI